MAVHLTFRDAKTCFVSSSICLAEDVNIPFFPPWPHAVLIIPDEYFHKCKPLSRDWPSAKCKGSFFIPGWKKSNLGPLTLISPLLVSGKGL